MIDKIRSYGPFLFSLQFYFAADSHMQSPSMSFFTRNAVPFVNLR